METVTRVEITYYCDTCEQTETTEGEFGDQTNDDKLTPVGWGVDDEGRLLCEEHYAEYEERAESE